MNVARLTEVDYHRLSRVGQLHCLCLRLPQLRPVAVTRRRLFRHVVGELHPVEREIPLSPFLPPLLDQEREQRRMFIRRPGIRFTLVPNDALHAVPNRRMDHPGEDVSWTRIIDEPVARSLRYGLLFRLRFCAVRFPFFRRRDEIRLPLRRLQLRLALGGALHQRLESGILFQRGAPDPRFRGRTTPRVVDEPNRDAKNLVDVAAIEEADGAERLRALRRRGLPLAREIALQFLRTNAWHGDEPQ